MLFDIAKIKVKAGDGGDGHVSFLRGKHNPLGGPDGGDGGNGGNVEIVSDHNLATLAAFRGKKSFSAQPGTRGGKKTKTGANGRDLVLKVPVGTLIFEVKDEKESLLGDLSRHRQRLLIVHGGGGGRGNASFKSSTNRTPKQFTRGAKGESKVLKLEVKLIADVGFIGLPNAGKSTLINQLTGANAKIGSYPFTTLIPNLGVCTLSNKKTAVIADIPGLIEGASRGKGLGDEFLRHTERTRLLVHLIDPYTSDRDKSFSKSALEKYETIRQELKEYGKNLIQKKEIVVINKLDIPEIKDSFKDIRQVFEKKDIEVLGISAITGEGIKHLRDKLTEALDFVLQETRFEPDDLPRVYTINNLPNKRLVFKKPHTAVR